MRSQLSETNPEAEKTLIELLRKMSPAERLQRACALSREMMLKRWDEVSKANPGASEDELKVRFVELNYGQELAASLRAYLAKRRNITPEQG